MAEISAEAAPQLTEAEMAELADIGVRRPMAVGEYLYREGDVSYDFFVVESGAVDIFTGSGEARRVLLRHGSGRFLGELNMLTGQRVFVSAQVVEAGDVTVVARDRLRRLIATRPGLGDKILAAFIARRRLLLDEAADSIQVIGSRYSAPSTKVREFLARSRIPHQWHDAERDPEIETTLQALHVDAGDLPVVITAGGVMRQATPGVLSDYLGLTVQSLPGRCFDLVVVGGGPAGLAASVYGASEGLDTLAVEMIGVGGQAGTSSRIENYLGFPTGISGGDLTARAMVQAEKFGANFSSPCEAVALREEAGHLVVALSDGTEVVGRAVIIASGARYRRLDVAGLDAFEGSGVFYAATELEARLCAASPVVVVGGGNSAGQAAVFLAESGSPVTVVIRGADLGASMSRYLVDRIDGHPAIEVRTRTEVVGLQGGQALRAVELKADGGVEELACAAVFSFIGADPSSAWLSGCAALDDHGFVLTGVALGQDHLGERWTTLGRVPFPYETSRPGLFAVGDIRSGSTKRVAAAVGEGSACVGSVHQFLAFST